MDSVYFYDTIGRGYARRADLGRCAHGPVPVKLPVMAGLRAGKGRAAGRGRGLLLRQLEIRRAACRAPAAFTVHVLKGLEN